MVASRLFIIDVARRAGRRLVMALVASTISTTAFADEGGVSFWMPGQFGSFVAAPAEPGASLALVYYHAATDAGAGRAFPRGGRIAAGLDVRVDLLLVSPTYVFDSPVLGAQAALSLAGYIGRADVSTTATIEGPLGGSFSSGLRDSLTGIGDLYPSASLRWNRDNHHTMLYAMGGVPVGSYRADRLANLGTNHWAFDAGGGYTFLDTKTGFEFSAALGLTWNGENDATDYRNGISAHVDWAASKFVSERVHAGLAGYVYRQLEGDSGAGTVLGDFKSRVSGIGPQVGVFLPVANGQVYVNLKVIHEFDARNRPAGWNAWVTVSIPI